MLPGVAAARHLGRQLGRHGPRQKDREQGIGENGEEMILEYRVPSTEYRVVEANGGCCSVRCGFFSYQWRLSLFRESSLRLQNSISNIDRILLGTRYSLVGAAGLAAGAGPRPVHGARAEH